ncbi:MAG: HipA domain-containing protein [Bacteroidota bacterium]
MKALEVCPGTLAEGYSSYSPVCLKNVFNSQKVSPVLSYFPPDKDEQVVEQFIENRKRISISGVQEKLSLVLDERILRLTEEEEQGTHILKPIPRDLRRVKQVPANEHLTMQIAKQVYKLKVAENALIFFKDGTPAYLTKRFDLKEDGEKWGVEDFATLAGKSIDSGGSNFKYEYTYEEIGALIRQYVPAWRVEIERYFKLVLFNYLFSNGDAHLKNFSLLETSKGDHLLSPAYDLINTSLHVSDTAFALSKGLFTDDFKSIDYQRNAYPSRRDFAEFGKRIGVQERRIERLIAPFLEKQSMVETLLKRSFLDESSKKGYQISYNTKRNYLNA